MNTVSHPPARVKPEIQATLSEHAGLMVLVLTVLAKYRPSVSLFFVRRLDCPDLAYRLTKMDATRDGSDPSESVYHVNLSDDTCGCDCKGFQRWSHCKHRDGLLALQAERRLA
jgi:hypothetical protein